MSVARMMQQASAGAYSASSGGGGDFTSATYDSTYTLPSTITNLRGIEISDDETKILFIDHSAATNYLTKVELTTAGDLSTASVADTSSISSGTKSSLFLQSSTIVWAMDASYDNIKKYTLNSSFGNTISSTVTTAVPAGANTTASDNPNSVSFNDNGSKMFIGDFNADGIQEFALSINYTPSSATYTDNGDVSAQTGLPYAHCWNSDGTKLYVLKTGAGTSEMYQYSLSVAYDVSSKSYDGYLLLDDDVLTSSSVLAITVNSDDTVLYVSGTNFSTNKSYIVKYST